MQTNNKILVLMIIAVIALTHSICRADAKTNYDVATEYYIYQNITTNLPSVANKWAVITTDKGDVSWYWTIHGHSKPTKAWLDANMSDAIKWKSERNKEKDADTFAKDKDFDAFLDVLNERFSAIQMNPAAVTDITWKELKKKRKEKNK